MSRAALVAVALASAGVPQRTSPSIPDARPLILQSAGWNWTIVDVGRGSVTLTADLDGDDLQDFVAHGSFGPIFVQFGTGTGELHPAVRLPTNQPPATLRALALADIDGNSTQDVLALHSSPNHIEFFRSNPDRTFTDITAQTFGTVTGAFLAGVFADFDRDGDLDLVLGEDSGPLRFFVNDGTPRFTEQALGPGDAMQPSHIAAGDLDGDGYPDLVVANGRQFTAIWDNHVLYNDGTGRFPTARVLPGMRDVTTRAALHDFDGDGDLDCLLCNFGYPHGVVFYRNQGGQLLIDPTVRLNPPAVLGSRGCDDLAVLDVDLDGDLDVATVPLYPYNLLWIWRNDGTGHFTGTSDPTVVRIDRWQVGLTDSVLVADFDGDGDDDVFVGDCEPNGFRVCNVMAFNAHVQLDSDGTARLGQQHGVRLWGQPGQAVFFAGTRLPRFLPTAWGRLWLDPSTLAIAGGPTPVHPDTGAWLVLRIPNDPSLRNREVWFQALHHATDPRWRKLTNAHRVVIE